MGWRIEGGTLSALRLPRLPGAAGGGQGGDAGHRRRLSEQVSG
jgi:hypothetical protein